MTAHQLTPDQLNSLLVMYLDMYLEKLVCDVSITNVGSLYNRSLKQLSFVFCRACWIFCVARACFIFVFLQGLLNFFLVFAGPAGLLQPARLHQRHLHQPGLPHRAQQHVRGSVCAAVKDSLPGQLPLGRSAPAVYGRAVLHPVGSG